jgi:hypothetical protein
MPGAGVGRIVFDHVVSPKRMVPQRQTGPSHGKITELYSLKLSKKMSNILTQKTQPA